ncbi:DUF1836 domain-containing protein [Virgibacillus sp. SK37]|uniref:DUF1836 domain-containing protein n=1 Tax=Virgibacillus sp. SK37 TaxID=403957 RepID=UPI0004D14124|nr:DUF1836 domain-containing protein [Virgibacillus sp. SK37]AIF44087.1 hypothetical protein X953_13720 [Virgibacillus sp. SK37]
MKNLQELLNDMHLNTNMKIEEIPDLDLYMDQVIQLFENKYAPSKRYTEDKILTKTMINNYAKGQLFYPINNKKYSKNHLLLISLIYQMKGTLTINDVKQTLHLLNSKITEEDFDLQQLYSSYLELTEANTETFKKDVVNHEEEVSQLVSKLMDEDEDYLKQLLLVAVFTNMSNFYRRAAERIVDEIGRKETE